MECRYCGTEFVPSRFMGDRHVNCSQKCQRRSAYHNRQGEAHTRRECGKVFVPKSVERVTFCSRECAYTHKRSKPKPPPPKRVCVICGKEFEGRATAKYCSHECYKERGRRVARAAFVSVRETNPYVEKVCEYCGKTYHTNFMAASRSYCSKKCAGKAQRGKSDKKPPCSIEYVFRRDGGRCQICGRKLSLRHKFDENGGAPPHPHAPTRDHLVPTSWGGANGKRNVQLACWECNCLTKNARQPVQLRMLEWGTTAQLQAPGEGR